MRYCGNCGKALDLADPTLLATGACPSCHAAITSSGDLLPPSLNPAGRLPAHGASNAAGAPMDPMDPVTMPPMAHTPASIPPPPPPPPPPWPALAGGPRRPPARRARRPHLVLFLGGLLLLLGAAALMSADWHLLDLPRPPAIADGQTPTAFASVSSVAPDATPTGGPNATATRFSITPTPTPSAQPVLLVMPTHISLLLCFSATARFGVKNGGGGDLKWTATASTLVYHLSPTSGTLARGQQQTVTVSNIRSSGQITVAAPGAANAPQRVTITCGL